MMLAAIGSSLDTDKLAGRPFWEDQKIGRYINQRVRKVDRDRAMTD